MNPEHFTATNAAVIHCEYPSRESPAPDTFPDMIWASNYTRLACLTLFALFFAGNDFAPLCVLDGMNIQDWLQTHYFDAVRQLATGIASHDNGSLLESCVIGWDSWNEPNTALLGVEDLSRHSKDEQLKVGPMPTPFEAMRLGMGESLSIENWRFSSTGPKRAGNVTIDPRGIKAWLQPTEEEIDQDGRSKRWGWKRDPAWALGTCIWALHGVWDPESKRLLKPEYFKCKPDTPKEELEAGRDYWLPQFREYAKVIRSCHPEAILFIHPPVFKVPPKIDEVCHDIIKSRACFSTHFYDGVTLVTKYVNLFQTEP